MKLVPIDQIRIGMFVKLDLGWFDHTFSKSSFKIVNEQQIVQLRALKLASIRIVLAKSDPAVLAAPKAVPKVSAPVSVPVSPPAPGVIMVVDSIVEAKMERAVKLQKQRADIARCEDQFSMASSVIKNIDSQIFSRPQQTLAEAAKLIDSIAQVFSSENDALMHLIRYQQAGSQDMYFHTLNVAFVAMMLANELKCTAVQLKAIGTAALFHDVGKVNIPASIIKKTTPLSKAERNIYELHPSHGVEIGHKAGLDKSVLRVIADHHEFVDGSGFPQGLTGNKLSLLTRIITVANEYDNLCNHIDSAQSLTPHEALANMFSQRRSQFEPGIIAMLVKCLGIYPPGTLVRLSDNSFGLVVNVNVGMSLRPQILVYDEDIPADEAIILDLAQESDALRIEESLRPGALPKAVFDYLRPSNRLSYLLDSKSKSKQKNATADA